MIHFDEHIFQMGWNHQLGIDWDQFFSNPFTSSLFHVFHGKSCDFLQRYGENILEYGR